MKQHAELLREGNKEYAIILRPLTVHGVFDAVVAYYRDSSVNKPNQPTGWKKLQQQAVDR